jgi:hypothetical protein
MIIILHFTFRVIGHLHCMFVLDFLDVDNSAQLGLILSLRSYLVTRHPQVHKQFAVMLFRSLINNCTRKKVHTLHQ